MWPPQHGVFPKSRLCTSPSLRDWEADKAGALASSYTEFIHFKESERLLSSSPVLHIIRERAKEANLGVHFAWNKEAWVSERIHFLLISQRHREFVAVAMLQFSSDTSLLFDEALGESGPVSSNYNAHCSCGKTKGFLKKHAELIMLHWFGGEKTSYTIFLWPLFSKAWIRYKTLKKVSVLNVTIRKKWKGWRHSLMHEQSFWGVNYIALYIRP